MKNLDIEQIEKLLTGIVAKKNLKELRNRLENYEEQQEKDKIQQLNELLESDGWKVYKDHIDKLIAEKTQKLLTVSRTNLDSIQGYVRGMRHVIEESERLVNQLKREATGVIVKYPEQRW